ncbi:MAG: tryptophan-rich sensory protein [Lachnospiraceae bacterium]|nr:tryptophan-rich sensory protein [Lachnospiraceae bacterium]
MQPKLKTFLIAVAIPLITGAVSAFITRGSMETFGRLNKPPLSPPGFLFPIVWTILFILMGIASYLVYTSDQSQEAIKEALIVYGAQLAVNFFWSIFFFNLEWYLFAFFWLLLLWVLILYTIILFYRISKPAAYLLIPYLLWVTFAGYLNLGIYLLN